MRITVDEAREYFSHPSQRRFGLDPKDLPEGLEYWARGNVCGVFHAAFWPGVWMGHFGVKREGLGEYVDDARCVLDEFSQTLRPARVIGWIEEGNRAAIAFVRRIGFSEDGSMDLPGGGVVMFGWDGKWL